MVIALVAAILARFDMSEFSLDILGNKFSAKSLRENTEKAVQQNTEIAQLIQINQKETIEALSQFFKENYQPLIRIEAGSVAGPGAEEAQRVRQIIAEPAIPENPPYANDPQKNRFGGRNAAAAGYRADIRLLNDFSGIGSARYELVLSRLDAKPIEGNVRFYLHDTFPTNPVIQSSDSDGKVRLRQTIWGAFTIAVIVEQTDDRFEIDLEQEKALPKEIRDR